MDREIVIKIPNQLYKLIKEFPSDSNEGSIENVLMKAVEHGTPLPEGHGRLIDADVIWDLYHDNDYDFYEALDDAPTIIEAEKGAEK